MEKEIKSQKTKPLIIIFIIALLILVATLWLRKEEPEEGTDPEEIAIETEWEACGDLLEDERDGNTYETVEIGGQCWFAQNLRVGEEAEGLQELQNAQTAKDWEEKAENKPVYAVVDNIEGDANNYGYLYNWIAASEEEESICPQGWSVASDEDWHELESYLARNNCEKEREEEWGCYPVGAKLKVMDNVEGSDDWNKETHNCEGGEEYSCVGFDAFPSGFWYKTGRKHYFGRTAHFWTSSKHDDDTLAWARSLTHDNTDIYRYALPLEHGFSVRCIKD